MEFQENGTYQPLLWRRAIAALIDYAVVFVFDFTIIRFLGTQNPDGSYSVHGFPALIPLVFWFALIPGMEATFGYTLGKGLLDIKVVHERRKDYPLAVALKRHILDFIDLFFFGMIAILIIRSTDEHKRIGDFIAHSRVVSDKEDAPGKIRE